MFTQDINRLEQGNVLRFNNRFVGNEENSLSEDSFSFRRVVEADSFYIVTANTTNWVSRLLGSLLFFFAIE